MFSEKPSGDSSELTGQFVHLILDRLFHSRMAIPNASHRCAAYSPGISITVKTADGVIVPTASINLLPSWRSMYIPSALLATGSFQDTRDKIAEGCSLVPVIGRQAVV